MIPMRHLRDLKAGLGIESSGRDDVRSLGIALLLNLLRVGADYPGPSHPDTVAPGSGTTPLTKSDADVEHGVVVQAESTVLERDDGSEELSARQGLKSLLRNLSMLLSLSGTLFESGDQLRGSVNQFLFMHRTSSLWSTGDLDVLKRSHGIPSRIDREVSES